MEELKINLQPIYNNMTQFLLSLSVLIFTCLFFSLQGEAANSQKPNILFIMIDDLGKDWVSCYGADDIKTPNLDSLAAGGMKFQTPIPWAPARPHGLPSLPANILFEQAGSATGMCPAGAWDTLTGRKRKTPLLPV